MSSRSYLFVFETPERARQFVRLLAGCLSHIAMYVDGSHVQVLDGSNIGQHREIMRLARSSSAQHIRVDPEGGTHS